MSLLTGSSGNSWQPIMTANTATPSYWLNWRVLLCAIWVLISMVFASILVSIYEGPCISKRRSSGTGEEPAGILYEHEVWKPCLKGIHPVWLLAFRVFAFFVLLILLILNVAVDGGDIFYFYTQWTFTLITIYFGLGSLLSIYGCHRYHNKVGGVGTDNGNFDAEQGIYEAPTNAENPNESNGAKHLGSNQERCVCQTAGFWGYVFQIVFQMNAGAVMLTDCVFWFIIVPFLEIKDYDLNFLAFRFPTSSFDLSSSPSSGSLGFELHTFSCGLLFTSFSNGSSTPVSHFGGHTHSLICPPHLFHYGMHWWV
ncbi:uncharacterized protein LOC130796079 isoform X3 [Actinidia eriantha]|uniref:uncharacterized protein LOC130796079 isoform X3 n=1 Tax=Actinidia eriantha TaxID=165200 RepID=UPI002584AF8F|nr:uncharacterized protein LOC130796079 isoform X3 [Actinidia eriantha]